MPTVRNNAASKLPPGYRPVNARRCQVTARSLPGHRQVTTSLLPVDRQDSNMPVRIKAIPTSSLANQ
eukprot:3143612-Alexandrium_andersonii.AAC.1